MKETVETLQAKIQTAQTEHKRQLLDMQQKHIKKLADTGMTSIMRFQGLQSS